MATPEDPRVPSGPSPTRRWCYRGRMVNREEFERIVRAMRAEGVPLTMPNLMLRTELPRATIERWLEEVEASRREDAR